MQISTGNRNGWVCTTHLCHWCRMEVRAVVDSPMCCWLLLCGMGLFLGLQHGMCSGNRIYCRLECLLNMLGRGRLTWCLLGLKGNFVAQSPIVKPGLIETLKEVCEGALEPWFAVFSGNTNALVGSLFLPYVPAQVSFGGGALKIPFSFESIGFARLFHFSL